MKRQLLTIIKLEAYFQRYTNQFWAGRQWSCSVISSIPVLWGQEFTLPPANEPQCWENTIHMHIPENTEEMDAFLFSTLPMKTKVTGEMSLQASKLVKGLVWLLFAGNCMDFWRKLHGFLAETASHRTCRGTEHYFQGTLLVQRDLMPKMAEMITSLHCNHNGKQMPEGTPGKTSSAGSTFTVLPSQNCCEPFPAGTGDLYQWCKVNANYYQIPTKSKSLCYSLRNFFARR